ncbi:shikimate dehydrogenase [bacterium]|nr:shikimate dehydrogenase [bacterium]
MNSIKIDGQTKIVGLIGYPLAHTFSPGMHNACFCELGLNWVYLPFSVKQGGLSRTIDGLRAIENVQGVNVTIPYKEEVIEHLDDLSQEASLIGAVNTVSFSNGKATGDNTDAKGFMASLREEGFSPTGKDVLLLGAGGAGRAVAVSLAKEGVSRITLVDLSIGKVKGLASQIENSFREVEVRPARLEEITLEGIDLLINASGVGMKKGDPCLIDPSDLHSGLFVYDLIYNPARTPLLKEAAKKGARTANGLGMLVQQAALSFKIWTGKEAPIKVMKEVIIG